MKVHSPKSVNKDGLSKGFVETKAPIESVKSAVSKFGGIVDWKAHRVHSTVARSKTVEENLEDVQEEILQCRKRSEEAAEAEFLALNELENAKRRIHELTIELEIAQTEEQKAKQGSELAKLTTVENDDDDALAKAQLEIATVRHATAVSELKSISKELEVLRDEYSSLVCERDSALKNADDALAASKESEKELKELTTELVALRESLESAEAAHLEAEEKRIVEALAKEQDCYKWKKELEDAEEEFCRLNMQILPIDDLKSKVITASTLLSDLKAEMMTYMESKIREEELSKNDDTTTQSAVDLANKELEEVKLSIEKAIAEVECLKMAATSLKSQLEDEKSTMAITKKRGIRQSDVAASLEAELDKNTSEIIVVRGNVKEARKNSIELTNQLKYVVEEVDQVKSLARIAREELRKAKIEAEKAKAESKAMESRVLAAQKEVEASNASKMLALSAIKALQESNSSETTKKDSSTTVTISLEEYNELSERAREAEEQASIKMTEALSQIEMARESEVRSQEMLDEVSSELVVRNEALKAATEKASEAEEGKLAVEQELRIWKENKCDQEDAIPTTSARTSIEIKESTTSEQDDPIENEQSPKSLGRAESLSQSKEGKKKKRSFFPQMLTFLGKQKSEAK